MRHHHGGGCGGCLAGLAAFTIAALIVWTVQHAWPYLLGVLVVVLVVRAASGRGRG